MGRNLTDYHLIILSFLYDLYEERKSFESTFIVFMETEIEEVQGSCARGLRVAGLYDVHGCPRRIHRDIFLNVDTSSRESHLRIIFIAERTTESEI